jgi:hypothetical protein
MTIPDGSRVTAHSSFTKTWRLQNAGNCRWTRGYKLVFFSGADMGAPGSVLLPIEVPPGGTVDVSVNFTAPETPGLYESIWMLQSADGSVFGVGPASNQPVWVKVRVVAAPQGLTGTPQLPLATSSPTPTTVYLENAAYDFAGNACQAEWSNNDGVLPCPGVEGGSTGSIQPVAGIVMEDAVTYQVPSLLMLPPDSVVGIIQGTYPEYDVQAGDHLQATVGCVMDASSCSVLFRVAYQDSQGVINDLWSIGEFYDGQLFTLDLDLASLAGQRVRFILGISSLGDAVGDGAVWMAPRILHFPAPLATQEIPATPTPSETPVPASLVPTTTSTVVPMTATPVPGSETGGQTSFFQQILEFFVSFFKSLFGK